MAHSEKVVKRILKMVEQGHSYRTIADRVLGNQSKSSSVSDIVKRAGSPCTKAGGIDIFLLPDCQVREGVDTDHLIAAGQYIAEHRPDVIVCIGDFADMASLSIYDKPGSKHSEGLRYVDDISASKEAMGLFLSSFEDIKGYNPRLVMTLGNHEQRIERAISANPKHFEGVISMDDLCYEGFGWEVYDFLDIVNINGVNFSHYFINPNSLMKNVIGGNCDTKLKNLGFSFVAGHQQILQQGIMYRADGSAIQGLVAGAFYSHEEEYLPPHQGNLSHWRGAVMMRDVWDGTWDTEMLSIDRLVEGWG